MNLTSPNEDEYLLHLEIQNGQAFILRPRHLVALSSGIRVRTCWNFGIHHVISGRIRQIVYYGSGSLVIRGGNGLDLHTLQPDNSSSFKLEDGALIGYCPNACYRLCRTEAFLPYLLHRTGLCDYELQNGTFITQNQIPAQDLANTGNLLERSASVLLNGIGKLLGF